jgi:hypothetical protein
VPSPLQLGCGVVSVFLPAATTEWKIGSARAGAVFQEQQSSLRPSTEGRSLQSLSPLVSLSKEVLGTKGQKTDKREIG